MTSNSNYPKVEDDAIKKYCSVKVYCDIDYLLDKYTKIYSMAGLILDAIEKNEIYQESFGEIQNTDVYKFFQRVGYLVIFSEEINYLIPLPENDLDVNLCTDTLFNYSDKIIEVVTYTIKIIA